MALSKRLTQSRDRQVAGVKLTLSGNCRTSLVDPLRKSRRRKVKALRSQAPTFALTQNRYALQL